jgi:internalin A
MMRNKARNRDLIVGQAASLSIHHRSAGAMSWRRTGHWLAGGIPLLLGFGLLSLAVFTGCSPAPAPSVAPPEETAARPDVTPQVGALDEQPADPPEETPVGDAVKLAPLLEQIKQWGGQVEFDSQGRLTAIDLLRASLSDADVEQLLAVELPQLQQLRLKGSEITDASMPRVARLASLTTLDLDTVGVTDDGVRELSALSALQTLRMHRLTRLSDAVTACFQEFPKLEHLLLTDIYISDGGLEAIAGLENLRTLDLEGSDLIGDGGLELLAGMKNLQTLRVRSRSVSDTGLEYLAEMPQLRTLAIKDSLAVSDYGLEFVGRLTDLEDLSLAQAFQVTDEGLEHLAGLTKLRRLDLRRLAINGSGLVHLQGMTELEALDLGAAPLSEESLEHLKKLPRLSSLNLMATPLTDAGMKRLGELTGLRTLILRDVEISDAGLAELTAISNLGRLELRGVPITDASVPHLAKLSQLRELDIVQTKITEAGLAELKKSLPNARIAY